jgi:hypothetical protein
LLVGTGKEDMLGSTSLHAVDINNRHTHANIKFKFFIVSIF